MIGYIAGWEKKIHPVFFFLHTYYNFLKNSGNQLPWYKNEKKVVWDSGENNA